MVSVDLSSNQLTGGIPEGIASLGGVVNLNLSRNHLTGKFQKRLGTWIYWNRLTSQETIFVEKSHRACQN
jgi:hypothetical protein